MNTQELLDAITRLPLWLTAELSRSDETTMLCDAPVSATGDNRQHFHNCPGCFRTDRCSADVGSCRRGR